MRIRTKLFIPFLVLPLVSLALLGLLAYRSGQQAIQESLGRLFEIEALRGIEALDREVHALYRSGESWTSLDLMQDVLSDDIDGRISSFLVGQTRSEDVLARALVADARGRVVAASEPEWLGTTVATGLGRSPRNEREACRDDVSLPSQSPDRPGSIVTCRFPIQAHFDERRTIGTLSLSWDLVQAFAQVQSEEALVPKQGDLVLLRRDGLVVSAPAGHEDWLLSRNLVGSGSRAAALAVAGQRGFLVERLDARPHLLGYAHSIGPSGWSALVLEDTGSAFAPVERLRGAVVEVGTFMALLAVLLSIVLSARLTRPIRELDRAAERLQAGDFDLQIQPSSQDEIGSLSVTFNRMVRELKRQRAQLVDREYVDSLITGMIDGLFVVEASGVVRQANPALLRLIDRPASDVIGRPAASFFAGDTSTFEKEVLEAARMSGSARDVELVLASREGSLPVSVIVSAGLLPPLGDQPAPAVVCVATDITQRKIMEEQLRDARGGAEAAARAKSEFLATVSHEVRTPLYGVLGMADLLEGTRLTRQQRDYVETARRSGEALLAVFDDILDYSKMDAGRLELERVAFELRECVETTLEVLAGAAREKALELSLHVDDRVATRVVGDPNRLRQILLNLGSNAIKFTEAGSVVVRVEAVPRTPPGHVRFVVSDTGPGIPAATLDRLFEPFYQQDASTRRKHGGTGLGLAIARRLVELMNGRITVESEEGRGSTFSFEVELPEVVEPRPAPRVRPGALGGLRVLIVDDNAVNRQILREMLLSWRCVPEEAADAWEGLDKLRAAAETPGAFQLVLVDFQMPEMDGAEMAQIIKADPRFATLPLLLLTSMPEHGEAARMMGLGFAAYLTKPVRQGLLLHTIAAAVGLAEDSPGGRHLSLIKGSEGNETES